MKTKKVTRKNLRKHSLKRKILMLTLLAAIVIPPVAANAVVYTACGWYYTTTAVWPAASWGRCTFIPYYYNSVYGHSDWGKVGSAPTAYSGSYPAGYKVWATAYGSSYDYFNTNFGLSAHTL